jgi:branched-chain amino acid transport system permease protein
MEIARGLCSAATACDADHDGDEPPPAGLRRFLVRKRAAAAVTLFIGLLLGILAVGVGPAAAEGESVRGQLRNEGKPVADVSISVEQAGGAKIGDATTDAQGRWEVPVPGPGTYDVSLDEDSLPDGVSIREGQPDTRTVTVLTGQQKPVLFPLGKGTRTTESKFSQAIGLTAEGLRFGLIIALAAVGLSLIYGTTGLTNFAHGELISFGAIAAFFFNSTWGLPLIWAALLALVASGIAGWLLDFGLWSRLRKRGTGLIAMMIVSIGLSILLRYLFLYFIGGSTRSYTDYAAQAGIDLGPISLAAKDYWSMGIAIVMLGLTAWALLRTRIGKATRAVADNPALAAASGIDVERVIRIVWIAGAGLAGLGGILLGIAQQVSFQMGFQILLLVFAAVTLGGLGTAFGALVGSLVVGVVIQVSTLWIPPELKTVSALIVMILILLVRPQGILGRRERIG